MSKSVLITGVSRGIGAGLAREYLSRGYVVAGVSRNRPDALLDHPNMRFAAADLTDFDAVRPAIQLLQAQMENTTFETLFLNAGEYGPEPSRAENVSTQTFMKVLGLNVAAVKATLDACLTLGFLPKRAVASASISGLRPRAGMSNYATSKAALNALIKVYQLENPQIEFLPLGMCTVNTDLTKTFASVGPDLPELYALVHRALQPGYLASPDTRATDVAQLLDHANDLDLAWGDFHEIRELIPILEMVKRREFPTHNTLRAPAVC
jgi:NAD(P)-dependent dehydrogenase (short-subunit alcohol dehydrogenase family)